MKKSDRKIISQIAKRASKMFQEHGVPRSVIDCTLDITKAHEHTPLRLAGLLGTDDFNFGHDVVGIAQHLDHVTGELRQCFMPRFTAYDNY